MITSICVYFLAASCPPLPYPFLGRSYEDSPSIPDSLSLFDLREKLEDDRIWQSIGDDLEHPSAVGVLCCLLDLLDQIPYFPPLLPQAGKRLLNNVALYTCLL